MRSSWDELVLQHEEMGRENKRAREGEREEVSVEDEENGRGSICEAAGGNCGPRARQDQQISDLQGKGCIITAYTIIRFQWNELLSDQK